MRRERIIKQIEDIKQKQFYLKMCDKWDSGDYKLDREYTEQIEDLTKQLEALGDADEQ